MATKMLSRALLIGVAWSMFLTNAVLAQRQNQPPSPSPTPIPTALASAVTIPSTPLLPGKITIEGESLMGKTTATMGDVSVQNMARFGRQWSGDTQLFWRAPMKNLTLQFPIEVPRAGRYRLMWSFTKAPDYGAILVQVDNRTKEMGYFDGAGANVGVVTTGLGLGAFDLRQGTHKITLQTIGGAAPIGGGPIPQVQSTPHYVGLDKLQLQPEPGPPLTPTIAGVQLAGRYRGTQKITVAGKDFSANRADVKVILFRLWKHTGGFGNVIAVIKIEELTVTPLTASPQALELQIRDSYWGNYSLQVSVKKGDTVYESNAFDFSIPYPSS